MTSNAYLFRLASVVSTLLVLANAGNASEPPSSQSGEFFEKKIRPVLVEHCAKCHGADSPKLKGGLRIDSLAALLRGGDSGPALVPGKPAKSRLIDAITYKDVDLQMPPKGKLSEATISDFIAWVQGGAIWPDEKLAEKSVRVDFDILRRKSEHWAWKPVARPQVPPVKDSKWPHGAVDAFILAKLEAKGIRPAPPAERSTLLRRVTFDLTGLPPTPVEITNFLTDRSPDSYEKLVDRLLASPAYGERWARHWLDVVRYADSRGHEFDYTIPNAWQYRDYVIRAFNLDVPFNRFAAEHLAGDLLEVPRRNPTEGFNESVLGTGFWLLGEEVHSPVDIRQDLADRLDNRIDVLTKAFLGLTVSCARCHDHKFDAISSKDYYALFGILEGASPRLVRFDTLEHNRQVSADLARARESARLAIRKALAADAAPTLSKVSAYLQGARQALAPWPTTDANKTATTKPDSVTIELSPVLRKRLGEIADSRQLDGRLLAEWVAAVMAARRVVDDPLHVWAMVAADPGAVSAERLTELLRPVPGRQRPMAGCEVPNSAIVIDYASAGATSLAADEGAFGPGPDLPGAIRVGSGSQPEIRFAEEAAAVYDRAWDGIRAAPGAEGEAAALGRRLRAGRTIRTPSFTLTSGKLFYRVTGAGTAYVAVEGHSLIAGPLHGQIILDFRTGNGYRWIVHDLTPYKGRRAHVEFTPADGADLSIARVVQADREPVDVSRATLTLLEWLALQSPSSPEQLASAYERLFQEWAAKFKEDRPPGAADDAEGARLANWLLAHPGLLTGNTLHDAVGCAKREQTKIAEGLHKESRLAEAMLDGNGVDERVFVRGSPKALGETVPRRFLEALAGPSPLAAGSGSGRLELARQMTDSKLNPFLARVMVNRVWHHLFGRGIVASTDNFGVLGERPSHPELLDYLADDFVQRGWSVKGTVRSLVLSSAYRMESRSDDSAEAADPQDLLLHRMRQRRLEGEAIRDAILAAAGRLDTRPFGPPVPIHLTPFLDGRGKPASGPLDGNGRRSIYLAVRRNFLSPFLLAFDTPIPFSTVGRRTVSNVPAQALILLNDPFVQEQAGVWARKVLAKPGSARERVAEMYTRAFGRPPDESEYKACLAFLSKQAGLRGARMDETAAWSDLAHTLFNVKEFIFIR